MILLIVPSVNHTSLANSKKVWLESSHLFLTFITLMMVGTTESVAKSVTRFQIRSTSEYL